MNGPRHTPRYVDEEAQVRWMAADTGLPEDVVATVLAVELEYLATLGIAQPPVDYVFRWYERDPDRLPERQGWADIETLARDVERLVGVAREVAARILEAESRFFDQQ